MGYMMGGFHKWGTPHSWMVFVRESPFWVDDDRGFPYFRKPPHGYLKLSPGFCSNRCILLFLTTSLPSHLRYANGRKDFHQWPAATWNFMVNLWSTNNSFAGRLAPVCVWFLASINSQKKHPKTTGSPDPRLTYFFNHTESDSHRWRSIDPDSWKRKHVFKIDIRWHPKSMNLNWKNLPFIRPKFQGQANIPTAYGQNYSTVPPF